MPSCTCSSFDKGARRRAVLQGAVVCEQLDLADLASVENFAGKVATEPRIDYLICNAGVMACPFTLTKDGFEMQIGTNHFGHFQLVRKLSDKLKAQVSPLADKA